MPLWKKILFALFFAHSSVTHVPTAESHPAQKPIVSGSLASDEILLALFKEDEAKKLILSPMVDNPRYSSVQAEAKKIPGRWHNSPESLIALNPGLVILASYNNPALKARLRQANIPFIELNGFDRLQEIKENISAIGRSVQRPKEANALIKAFDLKLASLLRNRAQTKDRPKMLSYSPAAMPGGKNTLIDDIITTAGGRNLVAEIGVSGWARVSEELLVTMQPDYIVVGQGEKSSSELTSQISKDPLWKHMHAVKEQRFIFVDQTNLLSVSHHVLKAVEKIQQEMQKAAKPFGQLKISLGPDSTIKRSTSEQELSAMFGKDNIETTAVPVGEGETVQGTVVYPAEKTKKIFVIWKDAKKRVGVQTVRLSGNKSEWTLINGISLGSSLRELEKLNGRAFSLTGFEWDYAGTVLSWRNGKLHNDLQAGSDRIILRLDRSSNFPPTKGYELLIGDKEITSSHQGMQKLNPTVYEIIAEFN